MNDDGIERLCDAVRDDSLTPFVAIKEQQRTVAIAGRPNVGKSRLFNRLTGRRAAIVHDQPGVTRDINAAEAEGNYTLLDTGGIGLTEDLEDRNLAAAIEEQIFVALETAQVILFVTDGREGCVPLDEWIAERLRRAGREPVLVVNKIDLPEHEDRAADFARLGFAEVVAVSAEHGRGIEDLRAAIAGRLGPEPETAAADELERRIKICFAGRPNAGKSSLCNRLLASRRMVVSEIPGTTRDAVEQNLDYAAPGGETWPFRLVDTAGTRKESRLQSPVDYFSLVRVRQAVSRSDVVFLVLDAREGVTKQDQAFCGEIVRDGKALVVLVNKWDCVLEMFRSEPPQGYRNEKEFRRHFAQETRRQLFFLPDSPVLFVSAKTGYGMGRIPAAARELDARCGKNIPTPRVNRVLARLLERRPPPLVKGRRFKIYYGLQTGARPLRFRFFCNHAGKLNDTWRRYLEKSLIEELGLRGCCAQFEFTGKSGRGQKSRPGAGGEKSNCFGARP